MQPRRQRLPRPGPADRPATRRLLFGTAHSVRRTGKRLAAVVLDEHERGVVVEAGIERFGAERSSRRTVSSWVTASEVEAMSCSVSRSKYGAGTGLPRRSTMPSV